MSVRSFGASRRTPLVRWVLGLDAFVARTRPAWWWVGQLAVVLLGVHLAADRLDDLITSGLVATGIPWPEARAADHPRHLERGAPRAVRRRVGDGRLVPGVGRPGGELPRVGRSGDAPRDRCGGVLGSGEPRGRVGDCDGDRSNLVAPFWAYRGVAHRVDRGGDGGLAPVVAGPRPGGPQHAGTPPPVGRDPVDLAGGDRRRSRGPLRPAGLGVAAVSDLRDAIRDFWEDHRPEECPGPASKRGEPRRDLWSRSPNARGGLGDALLVLLAVLVMGSRTPIGGLLWYGILWKQERRATRRLKMKVSYLAKETKRTRGVRSQKQTHTRTLWTY